MPGAHDHILMGLSVSSVCAAGLFSHRWLLTRTVKGQRLVNCCGETTARCLLLILCGAGFVFGTLLAGGIIRPIVW